MTFDFNVPFIVIYFWQKKPIGHSKCYAQKGLIITRNRKMIKHLLGLTSLFLVVTLAGCASHRLQIVKNEPAIAKDQCQPKFYEVNEQVPSNSIYLAHASYSDSGFTMGCGKADRFMAMTKEACGLGANVIKIKAERNPNIWTSTCYRAEVAYYVLKEKITNKTKPTTIQSSDIDKVSKLKDLNNLKNSGAINQEEFEQLKKEIINSDK